MIQKTYSRKRLKNRSLKSRGSGGCTVGELSLDHNVEFRSLAAMAESTEPQKARFINSRSGIPGLYSDGLDVMENPKDNDCQKEFYDNITPSRTNTNQFNSQGPSRLNINEILIPSPRTPEKCIPAEMVIPSTSPIFTPLKKILMGMQYFSHKELPASPTPKRNALDFSKKLKFLNEIAHKDAKTGSQSSVDVSYEANEVEESDNGDVILSSQWWENDEEMITRNKLNESQVVFNRQEAIDKLSPRYTQSVQQPLNNFCEDDIYEEDDVRVDQFKRNYDDDIYSQEYEMIGFLSSQPRRNQADEYVDSDSEKEQDQSILDIRRLDKGDRSCLGSFDPQTQNHLNVQNTSLAPKLIMTQTDEIDSLGIIDRDTLQSFTELPKDTYNYSQMQLARPALPSFKSEKLPSFLESLPEPPSITEFESLLEGNKSSENSQMIRDVIKELEDERQLRSQQMRSCHINQNSKAPGIMTQRYCSQIKPAVESLDFRSDDDPESEVILSDTEVIILDSDGIIPDSEDENDNFENQECHGQIVYQKLSGNDFTISTQKSKSKSGQLDSSPLTQWFAGDILGETILESLPLPPRPLTSMISMIKDKGNNSK